MSKRLLVSEKLICDILQLLFYLDGELVSTNLASVKCLCRSIKSEISEKLNKMERRETFTAYKTAAPGHERELLRRDYIELAHIRKSFTSCDEVPYHLLS